MPIHRAFRSIHFGTPIRSDSIRSDPIAASQKKSSIRSDPIPSKKCFDPVRSNKKVLDPIRSDPSI